MEPTINNINDNESIVDETVVLEAIEDDETAEAEAVGERPFGRGRGRRGMRGGRPFGPNRPYRFALFVEEDGSYLLRSPDLKDHATKVESLAEVGATMQAAIEERAAEDAAAAQEAAKDAEYSGKFVLRLPKSMHRQLSELAEHEGVSLNQLALGFLAEGMGRAEMIQEFGERCGKHRGPRGGHGPEGRGRGGHGPEGRGPEGFGPRGGWGPEGRDFEGRGPEGRDAKGHAPEGRRFQGRGPWGRGPKGHGPRWFEGDVSGARETPSSPEQNAQSFV